MKVILTQQSLKSRLQIFQFLLVWYAYILHLYIIHFPRQFINATVDAMPTSGLLSSILIPVEACVEKIFSS